MLFLHFIAHLRTFIAIDRSRNKDTKLVTLPVNANQQCNLITHSLVHRQLYLWGLPHCYGVTKDISALYSKIWGLKNKASKKVFFFFFFLPTFTWYIHLSSFFQDSLNSIVNLQTGSPSRACVPTAPTMLFSCFRFSKEFDF